jgi:quinol monooxygenase YgiN
MMHGPAGIAVYKPKPGQARALEDLLAEHVPTLRQEELATSRSVVLLRSDDGSYIEIFEWASGHSPGKAHENGRVRALWDRIAAVAERKCLADLPSAHHNFPQFCPIEDVVS